MSSCPKPLNICFAVLRWFPKPGILDSEELTAPGYPLLPCPSVGFGFTSSLPTVHCPSAHRSHPRLRLQASVSVDLLDGLFRGGRGSLLSPWLGWTVGIFCCCQSGPRPQTAPPCGCMLGGQASWHSTPAAHSPPDLLARAGSPPPGVSSHACVPVLLDFLYKTQVRGANQYNFQDGESRVSNQEPGSF